MDCFVASLLAMTAGFILGIWQRQAHNNMQLSTFFNVTVKQ